MGRAEFESWGNESQPYLRPAACCLTVCVFSFHEASLRWRLYKSQSRRGFLPTHSISWRTLGPSLLDPPPTSGS